MATGLVQAGWVLAAIRGRCTDAMLHLEWEPFALAERGLLIWEAVGPKVGSFDGGFGAGLLAFVSATAKGLTHVDDAKIAVEAFARGVPGG